MKKANIIILTVCLLLIANISQAWRMARPVTLTYPLDERQVRRLNTILQELWNITNGRINVDIVTTSRTVADNGDIWLIQTGGTVYIQYKANDHIYTIGP
uniref:Uncharacterized protein n=1 Tax=viral metagenome TaxID=1070528 RepID=A0A6M3L4Z6_9ZZZZ